MVSSLLSKLFKRSNKFPKANGPHGVAIYVLPDIHGELSALIDAYRRIDEDINNFPSVKSIIVHLGDYVDRGPNSYQVIETLQQKSYGKTECIFLKGNHEEMLMDFLGKENDGYVWFSNGGQETLDSYRIHIPEDTPLNQRLEVLAEEFSCQLPKSHLNFFQSLRTYWQAGDYLFVHAGLRPSIPFDKQNEEDLIWIKDEFTRSKENFGMIVVHGHSSSDSPQIKSNRIGLDTRAYRTKYLSCLKIFEDTQTLL